MNVRRTRGVVPSVTRSVMQRGPTRTQLGVPVVFGDADAPPPHLAEDRQQVVARPVSLGGRVRSESSSDAVAQAGAKLGRAERGDVAHGGSRSRCGWRWLH